MTRIKRPIFAAGAAALMAVSLTACGGSAPADASTEDFCEVTNDTSWYADIEEDDYEGFVDAIKDYVDKLEEVGTPEDISDEAREGFEIQIEAAGDISADDLKEAEESGSADSPFETDLSEEEIEKVSAFQTYQVETCGGLDLEDLPTDLPTE